LSADRFEIHRAAGLGAAPAEGQVRLAAVQMEPVIGEAGNNVAACVAAAAQAHREGATLIAFPECALTGYCFTDPVEARAAAVDPAGPALEPLRRAASELGVFLAVGYLERHGDDLANVAAIFGPQGPAAYYRKTHLPFLGVDKFVTAGDEPLRVFEAAGLRVGLEICWDASFPEVTRVLALAGADLVLLPTNWPQEADIKTGWLPNTRAYENVIYFAAVNRVGTERGYVFHGKSRICGPGGETLVEGPADREAILVVDLDPVRARTKKIVRRGGEYWVDRIGERREDLYHLSALEPGDE
jgi:predicted amidohydrolase